MPSHRRQASSGVVVMLGSQPLPQQRGQVTSRRNDEDRRIAALSIVSPGIGGLPEKTPDPIADQHAAAGADRAREQ